ncbi:MAG: DUF177 domain-containing protein [Muribaculaceae bacterium]|nr:DUF177 domain-containing protein [Muribaculaceae bacterium]MDE6366161.1 DUF177 domain-containing protein [Muribaculaceae bacterium]
MGKFTEYKLMLKSLPEGKHTFEYHLDKQFFINMENSDVRDADINVTLDVDHRGDAYQLSFHLAGTLTVLCDRCLDELPLDIDAAYNLTVKYGEEYNDDSDTLLIIPESDNYLNVAYMIYDTAVLAIPPRHVHPQGKCNRAMSALNKKYGVSNAADDDTDFDRELIDDDIDDSGSSNED